MTDLPDPWLEIPGPDRVIDIPERAVFTAPEGYGIVLNDERIDAQSVEIGPEDTCGVWWRG